MNSTPVSTAPITPEDDQRNSDQLQANVERHAIEVAKAEKSLQVAQANLNQAIGQLNFWNSLKQQGVVFHVPKPISPLPFPSPNASENSENGEDPSGKELIN